MTPPSDRQVGTKVFFMVTCLCDTFFDSAAQAAVEVLEQSGCQVIFPEGQTCCGQPAFNAGDWPSARKVLRHTLKVFEGDFPVVVPSGSCAAMLFHGAPMVFENEPELPAAKGMGVTSWGGQFNARIALHQPCHTRGTQTIPSAEKLLRSIDGVELVPFDEPEQCCGFGGTFSVGFPYLSSAIGLKKINCLLANKPDYVVSPDMSCLMHQSGLAKKNKIDFHCLHVAQVLKNARKGRFS